MRTTVCLEWLDNTKLENVKFLEERQDKSPLKQMWWLEYRPNIANPGTSTFRCRFCNAGLKDPLIPKTSNNFKLKLSADEGFLFPDEKQFQNTIRNNVDKVLHKAVLAREELKKLCRYFVLVRKIFLTLSIKIGIIYN